MNIPEEIQKKIDEGFPFIVDKRLLYLAGDIGYSLSLDRMKEQEKEIEELKALVEQDAGQMAVYWRNKFKELKAENERLKEELSDSAYSHVKEFSIKQKEQNERLTGLLQRVKVYIDDLQAENTGDNSVGIFYDNELEDLHITINELLTPKKP